MNTGLQKAGMNMVLNLQGLTCANCGQKIERAAGQLPEVLSASLDFAGQKLFLELAVDKKQNRDIWVQKIQTIADQIEPGLRVALPDQKGHEHDHGEASESSRGKYLRLSLGTIIFAAALIFNLPPTVEFSMFLVSYLLIGGDVVLRAGQNIARGQVFDEFFLMSIATLGAFAIGEYPEGVAVMLFYQVGETLQDLAVNRSRRSISALLDIRPDFANLKVGEQVRKVSPEEVQIADLILVKPGERIPLDGYVVEGRSALDTSALTGESLLREVEPGSEVLSGSINKNGLLTIAVTKEFSESTVNKILDLVQNASSKKAPMENFITKFARIYTPIVVLAAIALALVPPLVTGASFSEWIYRGLVFLVVSCPCALVISIPLSFFGGIGGASRQGILVKGSNYLEALNFVDTVVFDKTGTLTKGVFAVTKLEPAANWSAEELLEYAAHAEGYSNHPIALSVLQAYGQEVDQRRLTNYEEIPGQGIRVKVDGKWVFAGNRKLMEAEKIVWTPANTWGTVIYLAIDRVFAGSLVIADEIKADSKSTIADLKTHGVKTIAMLTGDNQEVSQRIAEEIGLDQVYAELLPHQKVEYLEQLEQQKGLKRKLAFVGDGINDAPVLARADIGIAMGGVGSDAAIEAADIVLMTDEPSKLVTAIRVARKTRSIVTQNVTLALVVKGIILVLGAMGIASMWLAVFGDVGVALIATLNAMRAMWLK